jgi:uncharacterized small protein (DUF1192 family)
MELDTIFNTQLVSITSTVLAPFVLYRLLVSQKDSMIQLLKERLDGATAKIKDLESSSPDQLLQALDSRVAIMNKELERMKADSSTKQAEIASRELEISAIRTRLSDLMTLLDDTDLLCPSCRAPLSRRDSRTISGYVGEREVDAEVEYTEYECGATYKDRQRLTPCKCPPTTGSAA